MADSAEGSEIGKQEEQSPVKRLICPYCGDAQPMTQDGPERCRSCAGVFEPLSRQATHNAMGPWFVRDAQRPFQPGCSYETLVRLIQRGKVTKLSIVRGPTTRQFWTIAKRVPGIAHLLGYCHECDASVDPGDHGCHACGVTFGAFLDRNFLGLPEHRPLPWEQGGQADDPSARTWHGLPTIREMREEARRLSSFATDEELRGEVPVTGAAVAPAGSATPQAAEGDRNLEVTARLMRRRVARQQRTIFRLTALSTALVVFAMIALVGWIAATVDRSRESVGAGERTVEREPVVEVEPTAPVISDEPVAEDDLEPPPIVDSDEGRSAIDASRLAMMESEYERAEDLLSAARDEDRALADRIADCEEAVATLAAIKRDEPREAWPAALEETAADARRLLERLRLREFFP